jgi:hypothetical protein
MSKSLTKKAIEALRAMGAGAVVVRVDFEIRHSPRHGGGGTSGCRYYLEPGGLNVRYESMQRLWDAGPATQVDRYTRTVITDAGRAWLEANVVSA